MLEVAGEAFHLADVRQGPASWLSLPISRQMAAHSYSAERAASASPAAAMGAAEAVQLPGQPVPLTQVAPDGQAPLEELDRGVELAVLQ